MPNLSPSEFWKNFRLGSEISISGSFIYNGIFSFDLLSHFYYEEDSFEFLYNISVGIERLQKVAIVLSEHNKDNDQEEFERSLITHNHLELFHRIQQNNQINIGRVHTKFLGILSDFYRSTRYDKFNLKSVYKSNPSRDTLVNFISEQLKIEISIDMMGPTPNNNQIKKFIGKVIGKITVELYEIIKDRSSDLNLYTYEVPLGSKAYKIFIYQTFDFCDERTVQKEVLKYLLQSKKSVPFEKFLNELPHLELGDIGTNSYMDYLLNFHKKTEVFDEVEYLYEELESVKDRINYMDIFGEEGYDVDEESEEDIE